jgi:hypothetical protein
LKDARGRHGKVVVVVGGVHGVNTQSQNVNVTRERVIFASLMKLNSFIFDET